MCDPAPPYETLDDWIAHETIPFAIDSPGTLNSAIDMLIGSLDDGVETAWPGRGTSRR